MYSSKIKYEAIDQIEQVFIINPGMYIGNIFSTLTELYIKDKSSFEKKMIYFCPGLYKLFDEIIVNATDHYTRCSNNTKFSKVTDIKININDNRISISNNGEPIQLIETQEIDGKQLHIPEFIFSRLNTSSNYNVETKGDVGGMNGLGSVLTLLFSKYFSVEIFNKKEKKRWFQEFTHISNKGKQLSDYKKISKYILEDYECSDNMVKITFEPLFEKFEKSSESGRKKLTSFKDDNTIDMIIKRIYDLPVLFNCNFYYNEIKINSNFNNYLHTYNIETKTPIILENDKWTIAIGAASQQEIISYINGIYTFLGGTHVTYLLNTISRQIVNELKKIKKYENIKPEFIKSHLFLFISGKINAPTFNSQTKDYLSHDISVYKNTIPILSNDELSLILKPGFNLIQYIKNEIDAFNIKQIVKDGKVKKSQGNELKKTFEKLVDATVDKSKNDCTLILCEGDSAKGFIVNGYTALPNKGNYGIFPLRGKIINAMSNSESKVVANEEYKALQQIIGIDGTLDYSLDKNYAKLKYKHILLACDADVDGFHIQSLVLCLFYVKHPTLFKRKGFFQSLVTPIVKIKQGTKILSFNYESEFHNWEKSNNSAYHVNYYKGLGSFTNIEAREVFKEINQRTFDFIYSEELSTKEFIQKISQQNKAYNISFYKKNNTKNINDLAIELAFVTDNSDYRKEWINAYISNNEKDLIIEFTSNKKLIHEFINNELVMYSTENVNRSIPALMDGLKPSSRKIIYVMMKSKYNTPESKIKVSQLGSEVSKKTAYKHGDMSMNQTIIGLAQNYTESNNTPLLVNEGQFGTRLSYGSDAGSPRYIFTYKHPLFHKIIRNEDEIIYEYIHDEGEQLEPKFLYPIVPMVLINGPEGIATGWSSNITSFNIKDIIENIKESLKNDSFFEMLPYYEGFKGKIYKLENEIYSEGTYEIKENKKTLLITEVPIGTSYDKYYKMMLNIENTNVDQIILGEGKENSTAHIRIEFKSSELFEKEINDEKFMTKYKLISKIPMTNYTLIDAKGTVTEYKTYYNILKDFISERINLYEKRKKAYVKILEKEIEEIQNIVKYLNEIQNKKIKISDISQNELEDYLNKNNYLKINNNYDYLLNIRSVNLTKDNIKKQEEKLNKKEEELLNYKRKTPKELWLSELNELEKLL